jgi:hypothetical protein
MRHLSAHHAQTPRIKRTAVKVYDSVYTAHGVTIHQFIKHRCIRLSFILTQVLYITPPIQIKYVTKQKNRGRNFPGVERTCLPVATCMVPAIIENAIEGCTAFVIRN